MTKAKHGDTVKVHYTGKLADGSVFDSSQGEDRGPLEFVLGQGHVIAGFDAGVLGMALGETKTIVIPVEEAYGPRRDDLVFSVNRAEMPEGFTPGLGEVLLMHGDEPDAEPVPVKISAFDDESVTLDANHDLADKELTFDLELVEVA